MTATGRKPSQSVSEKCFHSLPVLTSLARTIINKYKRAIIKELESREYFDELNTVPTAEEIGMWEADISEAEEKRTHKPEAMDVMAPRIPTGQFVLLPHSSDSLDLTCTIGPLAPTLADKRLELLKEQEQGVAGETAWMITGLKLEEKQ